MSPLERLLRNLTSNLIVDENYYDFLNLNSINPDAWPEGKVKNIALTYFEKRLTGGHGPAAAQVIDQLDFCLEADHLPLQPTVLVGLYWTELKNHRGLQLATEIAKDPGNYEHYLLSAAAPRAKEDLMHYGEMIESTFQKSNITAAKGSSERPIENWRHLSSLVSGFNPERVGIVLAATGFGKTTLATNLAIAASKTMSVIYYNMEMSTQDFTEKLIIGEGRLNYGQYKRNPEVYKDQVAAIMSRQLNQKLYFSNGKTLSVIDILGQSRAHAKKHGVDFIVIDYDQKLALQNKGNLPEWRCLQIAIEQFEEMAKQLQCFVLVLAQENKDGGISGSMRSAFPATFVLRFYEHEATKKPVIEAIKNRFGKKHSIIEIKYTPEQSHVEEVGPFIFDETIAQTKRRIDSLYPVRRT